MSGYIGSKASVTLVDGYTQAEADAEFVAKAGDTMTGGLTVGGSFTSLGIDDNATSTAVTIDSAGRVTTPYQPAFHAYGNGATSSMTAAGANPVYNVTVFNIGNCYSTTNGVFTAQVGGVYYFAMGVYMFANSAHNRIELKASTGVFQYEISSPSSAAHSEMLTGTIYLNAGDTCYPWIQSDSNSTYYRAQHHSWFEGYLVG